MECNDNEFIFCFYITNYYNLKEKDKPILAVENIIQSDSFFNYFKYIFIIFQLDSESNFKKFYEDEIANKYLNNNKEKKLSILFNFLSSYKNRENKNNNLINIFQENKKILILPNTMMLPIIFLFWIITTKLSKYHHLI